MPKISKEKGNKFERKISRQLSSWMFGDKNVLYRDSSSGARKSIYCGDVVPANAHKFPWTIWPFFFELKNGYKNNIPTLSNQSQIHKWLNKLYGELTSEQFIPMLITQFHYQAALLITNIQLNVICEVCLAVPIKDQYYIHYVYPLDTIFQYNFYQCLPENINNYIMSSFKNTNYLTAIKVEEQPEKINELDEFSVITKNKDPKKIIKNNYETIGNIVGDII